ncbi:MAG: DUF3021 family protein [Clostridiales bacterium]|nr:DUF3021 family protein [Clostridiales bacterium]
MKDRIKDILGSFFISVTLINVAMLVLGSILMPQQQFGYEVFIYPLIYGVIGIIPAVIVREGRELSVKQMIIRHVIQMLLTVVLLLAFMFGGRTVDRELLIIAASVAVSVMIIYAGVVVISWFLDKKTADRMTEDLIRFQERQNSGL